MKRAFIVVLLLLAWVPGYCQFFRKIDNWLRQRQSKQAYDTTCSVALLYYYRKWYFGAYGALDSLLFMREDDASMLMGRLKSSANLTAGIRF